MDDYNKIDKKIDTILNRIGSIDVTLAEQHMSLKEHMRRSDHIEKYVDIVKKEVDEVKKQMYIVQGGTKVVLSIGAVIGGLLMIVKLLKGIS